MNTASFCLVFIVKYTIFINSVFPYSEAEPFMTLKLSNRNKRATAICVIINVFSSCHSSDLHAYEYYGVFFYTLQKLRIEIYNQFSHSKKHSIINFDGERNYQQHFYDSLIKLLGNMILSLVKQYHVQIFFKKLTETYQS